MNKLSDTLYTIDSTGKTRVWRQEQQGNKYRTVAGVKGSDNLVTSDWTTCEGKNGGKANETSGIDQAEKEVLAKYKKQLKTGYAKNEKDASEGTSYVEPMLAKKYDEVSFSFPVYTQPKLDGMRCILRKDGMWSRTGKKINSAPHIYSALKHLFDDDSSLIFDGELFCDKYKNDFNSIISLAKQTRPTQDDLTKSELSLQYWVYDLPSSKDSFGKRFIKLNKLIPKHSSIVIVPTSMVSNQEELDSKYSEYLSDGQEGQMIRLDDVYENKRSKFLLKRKEFVDDEFEILDITEGNGNRSGMFGRARCITKDGIEFEANARGNEDFYTDLLKNRKKYIGEMATIRYQNITPDGKPRFGVITSIRNYE
jgi:ATP-dependent DNA ligase